MRVGSAQRERSLWRCRITRILDILWVALIIISWATPTISTATLSPHIEKVGSIVENSGQTLQGAIGSYAGVWNADALTSVTRYFTAYGVAFSPDGQTCYVGEAYKNRILAVDVNGGTITTVSGGIRGLQDGSTEGAKFSWPYGVALAPDANTLYVADSGNDCVRAVSLSEGTVSTIAGGGAGSRGYKDGPADEARFAWPYGVAVSPDGNTVYVADSGNNRIRSIDVNAGTVSTLAGAGIAGFQDGSNLKSRFYGPRGVAASPCGQFVYVADYSNFRVRVIELGNQRTVYTLFGGGTEIYRPAGVAVTADGGMVFASDTANVKIRGVQVTLPTVPLGFPSAATGIQGLGEPSAAPSGMITPTPSRRSAEATRRIGKDYWGVAADGTQMEAPYRYKVAGEIEELHIRHAMTAVIMFMFLAFLGSLGIVAGALWQRRNALKMLRHYQASIKHYPEPDIALDIPLDLFDGEDVTNGCSPISSSRQSLVLQQAQSRVGKDDWVVQTQVNKQAPVVRRANSITWPAENDDTRPIQHQRSVDKLSTVFRRAQC